MMKLHLPAIPPNEGARLLARFREAGVLLRPLGNTVYVMPPYCIEADDLAAVHTAIAEAGARVGLYHRATL